MGKASRNEIKKLEAAYLNGIAISFFVAGLVVPYVALIQYLAGLPNVLSIPLFTMNNFFFAVTTIAAITLSVYIHNLAKSPLKEIED
jgi:hypothetical protein